MIIHSILTFLLLIINVRANTEILNFRIKNNNNLELLSNTLDFNLLLNVNEQQSLSISTKEDVNKQFYKINLNYEPIGFISTHWQIIERRLGLEAYTVRLCWPASYPTSFDLSIYSTSDDIDSTASAPDQIPIILSITASSTGIPFPNSNLSSTSTTPFTLLLEPLYLTFLPSSSLRLILGIMLVIGLIVGSGLIGKVGNYLESVGRDEVAEEEDRLKEE